VRDDYETVRVVGLDGYTGMFSKEEVEEHLIFLALKVNGVTLPREHGFPIRVVAEDILEGKWVKWIDYMVIY
jgi:sulfoxide reductase catalytic subunit YedY